MDITGHIPKENEEIKNGIFKITVISTDEQTVNKVRIEIVKKDDEDKENS